MGLARRRILEASEVPDGFVDSEAATATRAHGEDLTIDVVELMGFLTGLEKGTVAPRVIPGLAESNPKVRRNHGATSLHDGTPSYSRS
jgi:hypothetical protein